MNINNIYFINRSLTSLDVPKSRFRLDCSHYLFDSLLDVIEHVLLFDTTYCDEPLDNIYTINLTYALCGWTPSLNRGNVPLS